MASLLVRPDGALNPHDPGRVGALLVDGQRITRPVPSGDRECSGARLRAPSAGTGAAAARDSPRSGR